MLWDRCLSVSLCSVCVSVTLVYCGQTSGWIKMSLSTEIGLDPGDIVIDGDPSASKKRAHHPHFRPMSIVEKRLWFKMPVATAVDLGSCHIVLMGTQLPQNGHSPQFSQYTWAENWGLRPFWGSWVPI